ncbi:hypothetical protein [Staphylococcus arlettae]|uniref:hypothetical protein n=1 Tax=Staphylococcus arlettae TaxID=29378 RepID=UPI000D1A8E6D|nr:hypothetical protein [Staphylococcus arlettae]PUZ31038.1 hypothetical protein BU606_12405 [Staphylococcus arlettae]
MAYEYESDIPKFLKGIESEHPLDLSKEIKEIQEVYRKARAFDHIKLIYDKNMNEMSISDAECIEMIGNELERADDEY